MTVEMKEFEVWCREYSKRWNKKEQWDYFCLVKDAWISGYKKAREEGYKATGDIRITSLGESAMSVDVGNPQTGGNENA